MIHEKFANQFDGFTEDTELFEAKRKLLERSSKVIAISETTKEDIVSIFGVDRSKIEVVYLGNSLTPLIQGTVRLIAEDYVLFVGNRAAYKNFSFLVKAIADQLVDSNVKLICAGGGAFTFEEQRLIQVLGLEEYVCFKPIGSDTDLANYYSNALFFVFPSLYEGFGIPVLESFACNCPALLSTGGSLPEIGGDAALYFDPSNAESLREAFRQLLEQEALRAVLKTKGARRLEAFSWDTTFRDTLAIYQSVLR
jgi:glycosyltransferase involved in cell wall biosynthesis